MDIDGFAFPFMRFISVIFLIVGVYALVIVPMFWMRRQRVLATVTEEEKIMNGTHENSHNYTLSFLYRGMNYTKDYCAQFKQFSVGDRVLMIYCDFPKRLVVDRPMPGYAGLILLFEISLLFFNMRWFFSNITSSPSSLIWILFGLGFFFLLMGLEKLFNAMEQRKGAVIVDAVISEITETTMQTMNDTVMNDSGGHYIKVYMPIYDVTYHGVLHRYSHGYYTNLISYEVGEQVKVYLKLETMYIEEVCENRRNLRTGVILAVLGIAMLAAFVLFQFV